MKKLLLTLLTVVCAVSAWGYTLPTSTMDLKTITAGTMGTWADQNSYYLLDDYLLVSAASSRASVGNQKWITYESAGTGNSNLATNWTVSSPFKGSTAYTNQNYVTIQSGRTLVYRVKNCKSVSIYGKNNSNTKWFGVDIIEITDGKPSGVAYSLLYTKDANPHILSQTLDKDKEYVIDIEGIGTSNSQIYELAFERNVAVDNRQEPQLSLSATELEAHVGDAEFTEPIVTSAGGYTGSYTYSSSKPAVASVNANSGEVTIGAAGVAEITVAVPEGDANYKPRSVSYTITVHKVAPVGATFYESFDLFNGNGGNDDVWSNITQTPALGTYDNSGWTTEGKNYSGYQCVSIRKVDASTPSGLTTPAIGVAGYGRVQFDAESWGTDGSNFFVDIVGGGTFVADTNLEEGNISNEGTTATVAMTKTGNWTTFTLQLTGLTANSKFRFYAPANKRAFLDEVAVWVTPPTTTINITTPEGYSTFVSESAFEMPEGFMGAVAEMNGNELRWNWMYDEGEIVPANTPILVFGTEDSAEATLTTGGDAPATNYLVANTTGSTTATSTLAPSAAKFYALSYDANNENLGFYWRAANGASFDVPAGKVFLALPSSASARGFVLNGKTTGIKAVESVKASNVAYNLAGQRVAANDKGIVIVNGKKMLNK